MITIDDPNYSHKLNMIKSKFTLCKPSSISSSTVLPKPTPITLFLPKKNLLGFHRFLISWNVLFLIFVKENTYMFSNFSTQLLISSIMRCLRATPFLLVLVRETENKTTFSYVWITFEFRSKTHFHFRIQGNDFRKNNSNNMK